MYFIEPGQPITVLFQFPTGESPDSVVSKDGLAFVDTENNASEISDGYYKLALTADDLSGAKDILLRVFGTVDYWVTFQIRSLNEEIVKIVRGQLQGLDISGAIEEANRGIKQFIATEHLTTRARNKR